MPLAAAAGLCLVLAALAAVGSARSGGGVDAGDAALEIEVFPNAPGGGFGYRIVSGGRTVVHQPHVPGVPGMAGFASERDARSLATYVRDLMRAGAFPPSVKTRVLDSLDVVTTGRDVSPRRER